MGLRNGAGRPVKQYGTTITQLTTAKTAKTAAVFHRRRMQKTTVIRSKPAAYWIRKCELRSQTQENFPKNAVTVAKEASKPAATSRPRKLSLKRKKFIIAAQDLA